MPVVAFKHTSDRAKTPRLKHTRTKQIPHACRDLGWLAYSPDVRRAVAEARSAVAAAGNRVEGDAAGPMRFCLKMSAFPKSLEHTAGEVLLEGGVVGGFGFVVGWWVGCLGMRGGPCHALNYESLPHPPCHNPDGLMHTPNLE